MMVRNLQQAFAKNTELALNIVEQMSQDIADTTKRLEEKKELTYARKQYLQERQLMIDELRAVVQQYDVLVSNMNISIHHLRNQHKKEVDYLKSKRNREIIYVDKESLRKLSFDRARM